MKIQPLRPRLLTRSPLAVLVALALGSAASSAAALGFGRAQTTAVLGMPLDFRVGLRLEDNETLDPACMASTVTVGDSQVPQSAISVVLEGAGANAALRVSTAVPMTEPLVVVNLSAGCTVRVTRRFTLFADPPGHRVMPVVATPPPAEAPSAAPAAPMAALVMPANASLAPPTVLPLAPPAGSVPAPAPVATNAPAPSSAPVSSPSPAAPAVPPAPAPVAPAPSASSPPPASLEKKAEPKPKAEPRREPSAAPKPPAKTAPKVAPKIGAGAAPSEAKPADAAGQGNAPPVAAGAPRLKLEAPRISARVIDAAAAAEREAALRNAEEAAISAKAAAEAAEARASQLERSIALLQQESKANRDALLRLTQAIEESGGSDWSQALLAALVGMFGVSAFLLYRLRRLQIASQQGWVRVSPEEGSLEAQAPAVASTHEDSFDSPLDRSTGPSVPAVASSAGAALAAQGDVAALTPLPSLSVDDLAGSPPSSGFAELDAETPLDRTQLLPPSASSVSPPLRAVSIEELLDLEQQVEFYTVLGQDDAALGLLVEHLRHTGGTYPLPFLKLMELYRRKGDADAYERTRDRFNQRFNAVAPAWGAPPAPQRGLDEYPDVIRQIQQAWSRPVDATAMLENMLFRTQGGELFDLSALADVLFLFTLARDLLENESGEVTSVDVLLPFDDMGSGESDRVPLMDVPPRPSPSAAETPLPSAARPNSSVALGISQVPSSSLSVPIASSVAVASVAAVSSSDIDIPLGEPMLEPLFQDAAQSSPAPRDERSLDFDLSDFDLPVATVTPAANQISPPPAAGSLDLDIEGLSLESVESRPPAEPGARGQS